MPWQLAISASIVAAVTTKLLQRRYAQKSTAPPTFPMLASYLFGVLPIGLAAGWFIFPHNITWSAWLILLLVTEGCSMAVSNWAAFRASRELSVAPAQAINRIATVVVIFLGWSILSEGLSLNQTVGGVIILAAAFLAIWAPVRVKVKRLDQVSPFILFLAVLSAVTLAIGLVTEKAVLGHMEIGGVFLVGWTAQTVAMLVLAAKDLKPPKLLHFAKTELKMAAGMGVANGVTGVFYVYALSRADNISLITILTNINVPLTVFGAYIFLKEKEHHALVWLSLGLSFVGLLVSSLR